MAALRTKRESIATALKTVDLNADPIKARIDKLSQYHYQRRKNAVGAVFLSGFLISGGGASPEKLALTES
ncbi:hypothetical protein [Pseudomonas sp.]|uniref:hypothetical protein n=1 Tax=Pseudomonas sp. TaxID=306 RepID=UPI0026107254|nr:hypothetical protein [Pseudomonas sp.]